MELKDIEIKQQKLSETGNQLKLKFFGIDSIIDQVIESISSWYCMSEFQERPLVVNLWGMTGVGKSDLIRELVNLLGFQNRYHHFDMGELGTGKAGDIRRNLSELSERNNEQPLIITLDEFQINRSIHEMGAEISNPHARIIWKLLDDGILQFDTDQFYHYENDLVMVIKELHYWKKRGLILKEGTVPLEFVEYLKDKNEKDLRNLTEKELESYFSRPANRPYFSSNEIERIHDWHKGEFLPFTAYKRFLRSLPMEGLIAYFEDQEEKHKKSKTISFTKALIFVVGNLDEVYQMHSDYSSDVCPNFIYELSKKIDVPKVKEALKKRYRTEQISRLGNNHIIYPSLNSAAFMNIIDGRLKEISDRIKTKHAITVDFDPSLKQWIYSEGVTATQGARPLLSALKYGIEDVLPKVLSHGYTMQVSFDKVLIKEKKGLIAEYYLKAEKVSESGFIVKSFIEKLKRNRKDDLQALVAVHESGHAICYMFTQGKYPLKVFSVSSKAFTGGMMHVENEDLLTVKGMQAKAVTMIGGFCAEKLVFGAENLSSGSMGDIEQLTEMVVFNFKNSGFHGCIPIRNGEHRDHFDHVNHNIKDIEDAAKNYIQNAEKEALEILRRENELLLNISRKLANQPSLDQEDLKVLVENYGSEELKSILATRRVGFWEILFNQDHEKSGE